MTIIDHRKPKNETVFGVDNIKIGDTFKLTKCSDNYVYIKISEDRIFCFTSNRAFQLTREWLNTNIELIDTKLHILDK